MRLNNVTTIRDFLSEKPYEFLIRKNTVWVDKLGAKRWNVHAYAEQKGAYAGIILLTKVTKHFIYNPMGPGKYYCTEDHLAKVYLFTDKWPIF